MEGRNPLAAGLDRKQLGIIASSRSWQRPMQAYSEVVDLNNTTRRREISLRRKSGVALR